MLPISACSQSSLCLTSLRLGWRSSPGLLGDQPGRCPNSVWPFTPPLPSPLHALLEPWQHPGGHCLDLSLIFDHSSVFWKCPFWSWGHALSGPISPVSQVRRGRKLTVPHKRLCLAWPVPGTYSPTAPLNTDSSSCPITVSVGSFMTALHPRTMPSRLHAP